MWFSRKEEEEEEEEEEDPYVVWRGSPRLKQNERDETRPCRHP